MAGKASKLHEKHQMVLANMLREEENKLCADCHAKGPRWASWNLGVFICIRCAGIHRNLGVHISRVKSVNLDSWTPEQIEAILKGGNGKARAIYEENLPENFRRPQDDYSVEQFIRNKYERKLFASKNKASVAKTADSARIPEKTKAKESKKPVAQNKDKLLAVPRPAAHTKRSSTPPISPSSNTHLHPSPLPSSTPPTISTSRSTPDLIAMDTTSKKPTKPEVDLLTGLPQGSASTPLPGQPVGQQEPSLGEDPHRAVKHNILSLYHSQPPGYQAYTAHGYPVNSFYYQQQQVSAMRMAQQQQQAALALAQVQQVEQQMRHLKVQQGQAASLGNGGPAMASSSGQPVVSGPQLLGPRQTAQPLTPGFPAPQHGGHTLNPHLW